MPAYPTEWATPPDTWVDYAPDDGHDYRVVITDPETGEVVGHACGDNLETAQRNARLMALAPEMLRAVRGTMVGINETPDNRPGQLAAKMRRLLPWLRAITVNTLSPTPSPIAEPKGQRCHCGAAICPAGMSYHVCGLGGGS